MIFSLTPVVTPHGHLLLERAEGLMDAAVAGRLEEAFARGGGHGLLQLGAGETGSILPSGLGWWRDFAMRYVTALRGVPDASAVAPLAEDDFSRLADEAPPMKGGEYLSARVLEELWNGMDAALAVQLAETKLSVQDYLKKHNPAWNMVGRVHFNLAENRKDEEHPFAFLATYTTGLSGRGQAKHVPLGQALREYAGASDKASLLQLLLPVQRAAESCAWLKKMVDSGEIFHPLHWTPKDALQFLQDVAALEDAGVIVRMPATWRMNRPRVPPLKLL